jgi:hypothetical protein
MVMKTTPFVLNDLPNGTYSVCWPGHEYDVVNDSAKAYKLLEIMFEVVGVDEAMIGVRESGRDNDWNTMYISGILWLEEHNREHMAKKLARYTIPGVRFTDIYQAEKFKDHMEQRLMWKQLGGQWG